MIPDSSSQPAQPATSPSATPPAPQTPPRAPAPPGKPFDWTAALDALGTRSVDSESIRRVREVLATAGVTGMPLHWLERDAIHRLRAEAARQLALADEIERRADPRWPEPALVNCASCGAVLDDDNADDADTHQCATE